jgi:hypothetical protein
MSRWDHETYRAQPRPFVLTVGCEAQLAARVHQAAALVGAVVREFDTVGAAVTTATSLRPLAIVLPPALFAEYPADFEALAREVSARLVVLEEGLDQQDLDKRIYDAAVAAERERATASK